MRYFTKICSSKYTPKFPGFFFPGGSPKFQICIFPWTSHEHLRSNSWPSPSTCYSSESSISEHGMSTLLLTQAINQDFSTYIEPIPRKSCQEWCQSTRVNLIPAGHHPPWSPRFQLGWRATTVTSRYSGRRRGRRMVPGGQREDKTALEETLPSTLSDLQEMRLGSVRKRGLLALPPPSQKLYSSQK